MDSPLRIPFGEEWIRTPIPGPIAFVQLKLNRKIGSRVEREMWNLSRKLADQNDQNDKSGVKRTSVGESLCLHTEVTKNCSGGRVYLDLSDRCASGSVSGLVQAGRGIRIRASNSPWFWIGFLATLGAIVWLAIRRA